MSPLTSGEPLRVVVADDHDSFRDGLFSLLATATGVTVVGQAASGEETIQRCQELQPDVVLMDLNMPGLDGIEATRRLVAASPHIAVLVLSMYEDDESIFNALRAGARGYLLKGADRAEITDAVRAVSSGAAILGPSIARRLVAYFATAAPATPGHAFPDLTDREREILDLIARGMNNSAITQRLVLSPKTVRNHISNIFGKLQVRDRAEAIVRAREAGLGRASR